MSGVVKLKTKTFDEMVEENCQCCRGFPWECCGCDQTCGKELWVSVDDIKPKLQTLRQALLDFPSMVSDPTTNEQSAITWHRDFLWKFDKFLGLGGEADQKP